MRALAAVLTNDYDTKHSRPFMGKANVSIDTRLAEGEADEIGTKADVGLECRLSGAEQTYRRRGPNRRL